MKLFFNNFYFYLIKTCSTNKHYRSVCNQNKEYIYKNLIQKDFFKNINYEFLYKLFDYEKEQIGSIFNK